MEIYNFKDLARASSVLMLTSDRVGEIEEDESMKIAKPILSKINAFGFVTEDSQMGKKEKINLKDNKIGDKWQRSYISGIMDRNIYKEFELKMDLIGETFILIKQHCEMYSEHSNPISVTRVSNQDGSFPTTTRCWTECESIYPQWINLLPDLGDEILDDMELMEQIEDEVVYVGITDMTWGRPWWLFETVHKILSEINN